MTRFNDETIFFIGKKLLMNYCPDLLGDYVEKIKSQQPQSDCLNSTFCIL